MLYKNSFFGFSTVCGKNNWEKCENLYIASKGSDAIIILTGWDEFNELDLIMAETSEIRSDIEFKEKNIGKFRTAGYFLELARIIEKRKLLES